MTFDSLTYPSHLPLESVSSPDIESHVGTYVPNTKPKTTHPKENNDDFCEQTQIANWECEGGAHSVRPTRVSRDERLRETSYLTAHIKKAETLLENGDYDAAFEELEAAAERFISYKNRLYSSFNASIATLTTLGCLATPPHPKALSLTRLRRQITT